jgi:hypothetical protein
LQRDPEWQREDAPINGRRDVADKAEKKAGKDEKESRSVAGRRFRKEGSILG